MAITASGLYLLTQEKFLIDTVGISVESETLVKMGLVLDSYTHNYDTHDFYDDVSASEVAASGNYSAGGNTLTTTEVTVGSPAAGQIKYDAADSSWATSTIANAMAGVVYLEAGTTAQDMLLCLLDFVTAVSTTSGTLTVQFAANGLYYVDGTP
jgi:hypothetical protein